MRKLILALAIGAAAATAQAEPLLGGFVEGAWAVRTQQNPALDGAGGELGFTERAYPRDELRGQLTLQDGMGDADVFLRFDLVSDARASERTQLDLREAYVKLYLTDWLDIKAGRQVATWGTDLSPNTWLRVTSDSEVHVQLSHTTWEFAWSVFAAHYRD